MPRADLAVLGRGAERARAPGRHAKGEGFMGGYFCTLPARGQGDGGAREGPKRWPLWSHFCPAEGSQVLRWQGKPCLAFGHPHLEHNT